MRLEAGVAAFLCALACGAFAAAAQPMKVGRVEIEYVEPTNKAHKPVSELLKQHRALERVQEVLVRVRWPRTLRFELRGCDGESDGFYDNAVVTVCYEYLDETWKRATSRKRPANITREEAFVGAFVDIAMHEAGHAMFDLLKVPILGREEDAADMVAAYFVLQLPKEKRRGLILGSAYTYANELKVRKPRDLYRPRLGVARHVKLADEHSTPAQRLYNLLCIAYGSDKELFADLVKEGYLPSERAELCEGEYRQIDYAYKKLLAPHIRGEAGAQAAREPGWSEVSSLKAPAPRHRPR
jgi:hypothetical protein